MKKCVTITVRPNGTTLIAGHPEGFPVDGDALVRGKKQDNRAKDILVADEALLGAARDWLGMTEDRFPGDGEDSRRHVAHLVSKLFPGGAARFIVHASYNRETAAAA
jgi:hypothetical protein